MASLPFSTHLNPTRAAALVAGAATVAAAALVLWLVGSIVAAAGFVATGIVAAGAVIAWRMLAPARVAATPTIDWAFTRAVAQASTDAVAITDRAGRLVCANDAYEALFEGFPTPPGLPLAGEGVAELGNAGRIAWRDGRGEVRGLRAGPHRLTAEIARAGDEGDMLVWRFAIVRQHDAAASTEALVTGAMGERLGTSGVMAALLGSDGRVRAANRLLARRAIAADTVHEKSHRIEVGLFETGMFINGREYAGAQLHERHAPGSSRSAAGEFTKPGYGAYKTQDDRWIYLLLLSNNHWARFCKTMELAEADDASLKTMHDRQQQRARVEKIVSSTVAGMSYEQVAEKLDTANVGYTEVMPFDKVLEQPQAGQPGKTRTSLFKGQEFALPNFPVASENFLSGLDAPPPELGQHTVDLVKSLGYSDAQCEALLGSGAVNAHGHMPANG